MCYAYRNPEQRKKNTIPKLVIKIMKIKENSKNKIINCP